MNKSQPIKNVEELHKFKDYYLNVEPNPRNYTLITIGLNTALRISDILTLRWKDIYDFTFKKYKTYLIIVEKKTSKTTQIYINESIQNALKWYSETLNCENAINENDYLFKVNDNTPVCRMQAYRIIKKAAQKCQISGVISPHSLRKTFGYHAWRQGTPPALLMDIYQHSSYSITKRYLGIEQDEKDDVFKNIIF